MLVFILICYLKGSTVIKRNLSYGEGLQIPILLYHKIFLYSIPKPIIGLVLEIQQYRLQREEGQLKT